MQPETLTGKGQRVKPAGTGDAAGNSPRGAVPGVASVLQSGYIFDPEIHRLTRNVPTFPDQEFV